MQALGTNGKLMGQMSKRYDWMRLFRVGLWMFSFSYVVQSYVDGVGLAVLSECTLHASVLLADIEFGLGVDGGDVDADVVVVAVQDVCCYAVCFLFWAVEFAPVAREDEGDVEWGAVDVDGSCPVAVGDLIVAGFAEGGDGEYGDGGEEEIDVFEHRWKGAIGVMVGSVGINSFLNSWFV